MNSDALMRGARRSVLIVEDEAVNRELLGFILGDSYDVLYAENGQAALELLRRGGARVSMILLDINMPVMGGIEFLSIARSDEALGKIPVIVLTAAKDAELETLRMGALDFITKPFDMPEIILARVRRIIEFVEDRQIIRDVERDDLTGLYTRGFFQEYCRRVLEGYQLEAPDMLALDIDRFRLVNEVYGKAFGDRVLCRVAEGIREAFDGRFSISCRSDADLFYILTERLEDCQAAYDAITAALRSDDIRQASVRLRMGVYRGVSAERPVEWYTDAAKAACGTIRNNYQRGVTVYDEQLHRQELYNDRLVSDMEAALERGQFKVFYQPKYAVRGETPRLSSAEALVRWQHPELGFVSPGAFIPLFEENGLILRLDEYVWREAARQSAEWRRRFGVAVPVSVNLSRTDFFDGRLMERLQGIVAETGVDVGDVTLEITESACSQDMGQMLDTLRALRAEGFKIEMDDFGSGYSALNMLCLMPIDALKIDMKFVQNIVHAASGYRMVELVVEMARALGVPAIVEGVETEEQYRLMRRAGCDIVQGYYFSRPMDAETFEKLLVEDIKIREGRRKSDADR